MMALAPAGGAERQAVSMTTEERAARIVAIRETARKALDYLMAELKAAILKAEATRAERLALHQAGVLVLAESPTPQADGPAGDGPNGPNGPDGPTGGSMGFYFVAEYAEDSDADGVDNACELYLSLNVLKTDSDNDGIPDGDEDSDTDGFNNLVECLLGTDPLLPEDGDGQPLLSGGVFSGQFDVSFTPSSYVNILGPLLDANRGLTADSLVTTEPSPGLLRLQWHSVFIQFGGFGPAGPGGGNPIITPEERNLLAAAFGHGTDINAGIISQPNQALIDQLPRDLLERAETGAVNSLRENMELIQKVNTGQYIPPTGDIPGFVRRRVALMHTQFTRLQSIGKSLAQRFGRAINRILPFAGGILILANAASIASDFLSAMNDYADDIAEFEDETGSAAIVSGRCNDLAPGAGNIVLNYLLR